MQSENISLPPPYLFCNMCYYVVLWPSEILNCCLTGPQNILAKGLFFVFFTKYENILCEFWSAVVFTLELFYWCRFCPFSLIMNLNRKKGYLNAVVVALVSFVNFWMSSQWIFGGILEDPPILTSSIMVSPHVVHWTPMGLEITFQNDGLSVTLLFLCI